MPEPTHQTVLIDGEKDLWFPGGDGCWKHFNELARTREQIDAQYGPTREVVLVPADEYATLTDPRRLARIRAFAIREAIGAVAAYGGLDGVGWMRELERFAQVVETDEMDDAQDDAAPTRPLPDAKPVDPAHLAIADLTDQERQAWEAALASRYDDALLPDDVQATAKELRRMSSTDWFPDHETRKFFRAAAGLIERQTRHNRALWDRISHDVWEAITRACGIDDYQAPAVEIIAAIKRYREHSVTLNTIGWRVAQALGEVPDGATEIAGNPTGQIERLIVDRDHLRSLVQLRDAKLTEVRAELARVYEDHDQAVKDRDSARDALRKVGEQRDRLKAELWELKQQVAVARAELADEQATHAKTAASFGEYVESSAEENNRLRQQFDDTRRALNRARQAFSELANTGSTAAAPVPDARAQEPAGVYTMTAPAPELPGMWEVADITGGQTDAQQDGR